MSHDDFSKTMVQLQEFRKKRDRILALINHTLDCDLGDPYRKSDSHDDHQMDLRTIFVSMPDRSNPQDFDGEHALELEELVIELHMSDYDRQWFSTMALEMSLCPLHFCDYAICFDDDDPGCSQIRDCFPDHDT